MVTSQNIIPVYAFNKNGIVSKSIEYPTEHEVKERLNSIYSDGFHSSFHNVSVNGIEKIMGVAYDFRPYLKKILVKQYGSWQEYFAPNKTLLRKCLYGTIEKMQYLND